MASIYFVCHPYNTPHIVKHTIYRWNTTRDHWSKILMSLRSKYIDCNDRKLKEGDICFVGEWECCSECRPCPTTNILFKDIHQPFITEMDNYQHILSTDPFVFGPRFYFTCCKKEAKIDYFGRTYAKYMSSRGRELYEKALCSEDEYNKVMELIKACLPTYQKY